MACEFIKKGIKLDCKNYAGGLKNAYFAEFKDNYGFTVVNDELTTLGTLAEVFKYELKNTANTFVETETTSRDTGTTFYDQVTEITTTGITVQKVNQLKLLSKDRFFIFLEDNNGKIFLSGLENGSDKTAGTRVTGGALGDLHGFTMSINGQEKEPAPFLSSTVLTSFKTLISDEYIDEPITPSV